MNISIGAGIAACGIALGVASAVIAGLYLTHNPECLWGLLAMFFAAAVGAGWAPSVEAG